MIFSPGESQGEIRPDYPTASPPHRSRRPAGKRTLRGRLEPTDSPTGAAPAVNLTTPPTPHSTSPAPTIVRAPLDRDAEVAPRKRAIEAALARLRGTIEHPRCLRIDPESRRALVLALSRVEALSLESSRPCLTIALVGCTGAGKSTLINALARARIARPGTIRPTTSAIRVYHHRLVPHGGLAEEVVGLIPAQFVPHDRPELETKTLVDTPDLDSVSVEHRQTTKAVLKAAQLVVYVFSHEKYMEERVWSVLRQEIVFSHSIAVLNKADEVSATDLDLITHDLKRRFADLGLAEIPIFRVCARRHAPADPGDPPPLNVIPQVDEMEALRDFLEQRLDRAEALRLIREQRANVLKDLRQLINETIPADRVERLERLMAETPERVRQVSERLIGQVGPALDAAEEEFRPLAVLRLHERFWGPFRGWLAVADFLTIGLSGLVRQLLGRPARGRPEAIVQIFERQGQALVGDALRDEALRFQTRLREAELPLEHWRTLTGSTTAEMVLSELGDALTRRIDEPSDPTRWSTRAVIFLASLIGAMLPFALAVFVLWQLTRDFLAGNYGGWDLVVHLTLMVLVFFVVLQMVVSLLMAGPSRKLGRGLGRLAIHDALGLHINRWTHTYRDDLLADRRDLLEPLDELDRLNELDLEPMSPPALPPAELPPPPAVGATPTPPTLDSTNIPSPTVPVELAAISGSTAPPTPTLTPTANPAPTGSRFSGFLSRRPETETGAGS